MNPAETANDSSFKHTKKRHRPIIRLFVSSTFSDLKLERDVLQQRVFPKLEQLCLKEGFQFQVIDLRWGVPTEAGLHHRTMQICFEELHSSQGISPEPNFLILLGNRYGWRPLPEEISTDEFGKLEEHTSNDSERATLAAWYRRDKNAVPPVYLLRARTDSPDGEDFTTVVDASGNPQDAPAWVNVQEILWAIINRAFPASELKNCFASPPSATGVLPSIIRFQASVTEQEIWCAVCSEC